MIQPSLFYMAHMLIRLNDRETDLWNYQLSLREIDKMRVESKFVDADGNRPPGQYVIIRFFCISPT